MHRWLLKWLHSWLHRSRRDPLARECRRKGQFRVSSLASFGSCTSRKLLRIPNFSSKVVCSCNPKLLGPELAKLVFFFGRWRLKKLIKQKKKKLIFQPHARHHPSSESCVLQMCVLVCGKQPNCNSETRQTRQMNRLFWRAARRHPLRAGAQQALTNRLTDTEETAPVEPPSAAHSFMSDSSCCSSTSASSFFFGTARASR